MGPEMQNGWLWVLSSLPSLSRSFSLSFSPQLLATPLLAACHTMMSWLLFAPGVPIDSISPLHTLYISPVHPALSPTSTPVFLSQSPSQILSPLKRRLGDLGMFGCCLAHPRYMLDTQIGEPSTLQIQLQLPFKSHWFNVPLLFSHSCDQLLFLFGYSAWFVLHPVCEVIINPLLICWPFCRSW